jgi:hypothetical protein
VAVNVGVAVRVEIGDGLEPCVAAVEGVGGVVLDLGDAVAPLGPVLQAAIRVATASPVMIPLR